MLTFIDGAKITKRQKENDIEARNSICYIQFAI